MLENEKIIKIAKDAKNRYPSAKGASIITFSNEKYSIISLHSEVDHGSGLGIYFYYNTSYVNNIETHGRIENIQEVK